MSTIFKNNNLYGDIREIKYKYSKKVKYVRIVLSNTLRVSVIIPYNHNINDAIDLVNSKKNGYKK